MTYNVFSGTLNPTHFTATVYANPELPTLTALERGNLGDEFLWPLCQISLVSCLTDWRQSSGTKEETLFRTNIEPTHCLEVMLSSCYCAIFGCCNIIEYYNCCWAAVCIIFSWNNFYWSYLSNDINFVCLWSLQPTSFRFQNRSRWGVSPYINSQCCNLFSKWNRFWRCVGPAHYHL